MTGIHTASKEGMFDLIKILEEHFHSPQKVYPPSANGIPLAAGTVSAWDHGTITEIIPAGIIGKDFDLHFALITALSANAQYEVIFYSGLAAAEVEICRVATSRNAVQSQEGSLPLLTELQPVGTRISASLASSSGVADTCVAKLFYHEY